MKFTLALTLAAASLAAAAPFKTEQAERDAAPAADVNNLAPRNPHPAPAPAPDAETEPQAIPYLPKKKPKPGNPWGGGWAPCAGPPCW